jgi:hypothetical protein
MFKKTESNQTQLSSTEFKNKLQLSSSKKWRWEKSCLNP